MTLSSVIRQRSRKSLETPFFFVVKEFNLALLNILFYFSATVILNMYVYSTLVSFGKEKTKFCVLLLCINRCRILKLCDMSTCLGTKTV